MGDNGYRVLADRCEAAGGEDATAALTWLAQQQTTAEVLALIISPWAKMTPEQRLDDLKAKKQARDAAIVQARAALNIPPAVDATFDPSAAKALAQ